MEEKIVQTAGRQKLGDFAKKFAHFNDDVLFWENRNNKDTDLKTLSLITVVALMAQGLTDDSLKFHIMNAKKHGVTKKRICGYCYPCGFLCGLVESVGRL